MLKMTEKTAALERYEEVAAVREAKAKSVFSAAEDLYTLRARGSMTVIGPVEAFFNSLANTPKNFEKAFERYRVELDMFNPELIEAAATEGFTRIEASSVFAGGAAVGATSAALMPTAAMAIATTFGTASTGAAISGLSGAAATNAALAWLGGGAMSAGGGGVVAGKALIALSGPVGWAIGAGVAVTGAAYIRHKNQGVINKIDSAVQDLKSQLAKLEVHSVAISELSTLTSKQMQGMTSIFETLSLSAPKNYLDFSDLQKTQFAALLNHVETLSMLLNKTVADAPAPVLEPEEEKVNFAGPYAALLHNVGITALANATKAVTEKNAKKSSS